MAEHVISMHSWNEVTGRAGLDVLLGQVLLKVHYRLYLQQMGLQTRTRPCKTTGRPVAAGSGADINVHVHRSGAWEEGRQVSSGQPLKRNAGAPQQQIPPGSTLLPRNFGQCPQIPSLVVQGKAALLHQS